jgi:hypothetical protein
MMVPLVPLVLLVAPTISQELARRRFILVELIEKLSKALDEVRAS